MKAFFNHPWQISFKDVLAIAFSGTFLFFCWCATGNKDALAVVQALVPLIGIVLGGYFVQEGAAMWFYKSQGMQAGSNYGNYGNYQVTTTPTAMETNTSSSQKGSEI